MFKTRCKLNGSYDTGSSKGSNCLKLSLHVSSLSPSQGNDSSICEHFKADRVNSFFIQDHKRFIISLGDFVLQVNDLLASFVGESSLALGHFISIASIGEEELRVNFSLFVL